MGATRGERKRHCTWYDQNGQGIFTFEIIKLNNVSILQATSRQI